MVKVACCWDDGVVNDIRLIELLKKYHGKATFNLNPGLMREGRDVSRWVPVGEGGFHGFVNGKVGLNELRDIYDGFTVASHGWLHLNANEHTAEEILKDALDARHYIEDVFQRDCPGFAWPYGRCTPEACKLLKDAGFAYGRTTEYTANVGATDAPLRLQSTCHFQDNKFWDKFLDAKARNGIFYFWGHSYEMLDCPGLWDQMEQKLAKFDEDPEVEWIDVIDIVR